MSLPNRPSWRARVDVLRLFLRALGQLLLLPLRVVREAVLVTRRRAAMDGLLRATAARAAAPPATAPTRR